MNFVRIWCITNPTPARRVTPPWNVYMAKFDPGWEGYPVWQTGLPALAGHPTYHVNAIKLKWEIIWTGGLPHLSGLPHLPGVPHLHVNRPLVQRQNQNTTICFKPLQVKSMEVQWEAVKLITYLKRYNWELVKTPKRKINETFQQTLKFSETRSIVRQCIQFNLFKVFSTTQIKCVEINPKTAASTSNYYYSSISDIFK